MKLKTDEPLGLVVLFHILSGRSNFYLQIFFICYSPQKSLQIEAEVSESSVCAIIFETILYPKKIVKKVNKLMSW